MKFTPLDEQACMYSLLSSSKRVNFIVAYDCLNSAHLSMSVVLFFTQKAQFEKILVGN